MRNSRRQDPVEAGRPVALVDRDHEWAALRALGAAPGPALALLYGRRRVGKTYLLRHVWPEDQVFFFTGSETTPAFNRTELVRAMAEWSGEEIRSQDYPTWRTVFRKLLELGDGEQAPLVIVLDEYQYFRGDEGEAVDSELNAAWEGYLYGRGARRPLTLILCGSAVGIMRELNTGGRPLYGRFDWQAHLRPFDYLDAARMTGAAELRDRVRYYGVYGGIPRYLATIDHRRSLGENVSRAVLVPDGAVRLQLETAIEQESGLVSPAEHRAIVAAIASGHTDRNTVAQAVGMAPDATFRSRLNTLVNLGYVAQSRNFAAPPNQPYRYTIADPAMRFYYALVHPYRDALADPAAAPRGWREVVRPRLDGYLGHSFEAMAREAYLRLSDQVDPALPLVRDWGRWEGLDRTKTPLEIDVVARAVDGRMITGAVKWNARPVSPALHADHLAMLQRLAAAGHRWAHEALADDAILLYLSASGFSEAFAAAASHEPRRVVMWSLEDLYGD